MSAPLLHSLPLGIFTGARDVGRGQWLAGTGCSRVEIEIGPGNCAFLKAAALRDPDCLYVGIEILPGSLARGRRSGALPANLRLIEADGGWVVRHLLADASVDAFHVYFPDPWWKKKHHKRRLFQSEFCAALGRVLVPGGPVYVVTDVVPVFHELSERMLAAGFVIEAWEARRDGVACSAYETKYRRQNRHFEQAIFRRGAAGAAS